MLAVKDAVIYQGIDALAAYREGRLTQRGYVRVMRDTKKRLATADVESLACVETTCCCRSVSRNVISG